MLTAVGADQFAGVRSSAHTDGAHVAAARTIAIDGAVELDFEANQRWRAKKIIHRRAPLRRRSPEGRTPGAHILKGAEAPLWDPHLSAREGAGGRLASCSSGALRVEGGESRLHFLGRRLRID